MNFTSISQMKEWKSCITEQVCIELHCSVLCTSFTLYSFRGRHVDLSEKHVASSFVFFFKAAPVDVGGPGGTPQGIQGWSWGVEERM